MNHSFLDLLTLQLAARLDCTQDVVCQHIMQALVKTGQPVSLIHLWPDVCRWTRRNWRHAWKASRIPSMMNRAISLDGGLRFFLPRTEETPSFSLVRLRDGSISISVPGRNTYSVEMFGYQPACYMYRYSQRRNCRASFKHKCFVTSSSRQAM